MVERKKNVTLEKEIRTMNKHKPGTSEEWLAARLKLLEAEKDLTRRSDQVARLYFAC